MLRLTSLFLGFSALIALSEDPPLIKRTFKEGAKREYAVTIDLALTSGQEVQLAVAMTQSVAGLDKDGGAKIKAAFSDMHIMIDGQDLGDLGKTPPDVEFLAKVDGSVSELKLPEDTITASVAELLIRASCLPLPASGLAAGAKWAVEVKDSAAPQLAGAKIQYEFSGPEDLPSGKASKVKVSFSGKSSDEFEALEFRGFLWVDPRTGELIKQTSDVTNLTIGGRTASGKMSIVPKAAETSKRDKPGT